MLREGKTGRKEGKITVYQLRGWQRARSSPTLTGTWQLQENTVCKLKGMDRPFFQLPSAARTGWRWILLSPAGTEKQRIHHHLPLLVPLSSILQSLSGYKLALRPQRLLWKPYTKLQVHRVRGTDCLWRSWKTGSWQYHSIYYSTS